MCCAQEFPEIVLGLVGHVIHTGGCQSHKVVNLPALFLTNGLFFTAFLRLGRTFGPGLPDATV